MSKRKTQEEFLKELKFKNKHDLDYSDFKYVSRRTKSNVRCNICGYVWPTTPQILLDNHGCPICTTKNRNSDARLTNEEVINNIKEKFGDKFLLDKVNYVNARTKILVGCKIHGYFPIRYHDLMYYHGCPYCNESLSETKLRVELSKTDIEFIQHFSFEWMRTTIYSKLSYDFYLPQYNIAIECQGRQHFEVVNAFGGEEEFLKVVKRDKNKVKLSEEHGVKLIYFLDKRFNKYMKEDDVYFNDVDELIKYVKTFG